MLRRGIPRFVTQLDSFSWETEGVAERNKQHWMHKTGPEVLNVEFGG